MILLYNQNSNHLNDYSAKFLGFKLFQRSWFNYLSSKKLFLNKNIMLKCCYKSNRICVIPEYTDEIIRNGEYIQYELSSSSTLFQIIKRPEDIVDNHSTIINETVIITEMDDDTLKLSEKHDLNHDDKNKKQDTDNIPEAETVSTEEKLEENCMTLIPISQNKIPVKITQKESDTEQIKEQHNGHNCEAIQSKNKRFLERKPGVKLKRSLTKEIKMPQSTTFNTNPETLPPFEHPKDGLCKTLLQLESNEWETIIQGLQGVVRLTKHHSKHLSPSLHAYVTLVSKHVRNLRSQVSRAACLSAQCIFKNMTRIADQDLEELVNALFLRTADTNKFLRADSNKALDMMMEHAKLSKCIVSILHKAANHPSTVMRTSAARLMCQLVQRHGANEALSMSKEVRETMINTVVKFLMDGNLETRSHAKEVFAILSADKRFSNILSETVPANIMSFINKSLSRIIHR